MVFPLLLDHGQFLKKYIFLEVLQTEENDQFLNLSQGLDQSFDQDPKRGLRIDHFLLSKELQEKYISSEIDHDLRAMEKPSDHCPVVLDLDLEFSQKILCLPLKISQNIMQSLTRPSK